MTGFGEFLGKTGEAAWQLFVWQIAGQIVTTALTPYLTELEYLVNETTPDVVLPVGDLVAEVIRGHTTQEDAAADAAKLGISAQRFEKLLEVARIKIAAPDLAQMVVRGFMDLPTATTEAGFTGWDAHRFELLTRIAADAPGAGDLAIGLRRGLLPEDSPDPLTPSFAGGIREGRLSNIWIPLYKGLAEQWPTPPDALQAEVEGQLTHDEAIATYKLLGGAERFYPWLLHTRGDGPTPNEALELWKRGIIPEHGDGPDALSYDQAFRESRFRNKWLEPYKGLKLYITPPRSVVPQIHSGVITDAEAAKLLAENGLDQAEITRYIAEGHARASLTDKNLTQAAVVNFYESRLITSDDAHGLLTALGYSAENATLIIEYADLRRIMAAVNAAVTRVHNLYVAHKITQDAARTTLNALKVPGDQIGELVHIWDLEQAVTVRQLTPAQITDAWHADLITQAEATGELTALGYTEFDAWLLLSEKNKKALPGKPARGPNPVGVIP